jgi:pSer/pThr/pTyr-binding forkhead associated (FHA) protein
MDLFLAACGMTGPLVLEVLRPGDDATPGRLVLEQPFALVGRAEGADVRLEDPRVGRRHVLLHVLGGRLYCADLESRSGIRRGGGAPGSGWLAPGEILEVGPFALRLAGGADAAEPGAAFDPMGGEGEPSGLPRVTLEFPGREVPAPPWPMNRVLAMVGRSPACRVRLGGSEVSQYHAALVRTPVGLWVVDLLGRHGIAVNGQSRRWGRLGDGDELTVRQHRVRVRYGDVVAFAPASAVMLPAPAAAGPLGALVGPAPGVPAVPEGAGVPAGLSPEQAALAEALVGPLMDRFTQSQQQMLGQVQQQMFDQFQQVLMVVLQMFGRMHRDQMDVVKRELADMRAISGELEATRAAVRRLEAAGPRAAVAPTVPSPPPPTPPPAAAPIPPPAGDGADAAPRPRPEPVAAVAGADLHAKLVERVAALQNEQQGRWQRLLGLMTGGAGETP